MNLEDQKKIYRDIFLNNDNGKFILNDLRSVFCINSDILAIGDDPQLNNHHREGLRIAYRYIESLLTKDEPK